MLDWSTHGLVILGCGVHGLQACDRNAQRSFAWRMREINVLGSKAQELEAVWVDVGRMQAALG